MKTTYYTFKLNKIIILISIFLLILSFAVNAQQRSRNGDRNQSQKRTATVERRENGRNERNTLHYSRKETTNSSHARYIERKEEPQKQNYTYKSKGYKHQAPGHKKQTVYHEKRHFVHVNPHYHYKYSHPSPWTYYNYPAVFYHRDYGEFYYHAGRFYRYDWRRGYFVVDLPTNIYFKTIPHGFRRVYIDGRIYYHYNGIYLRHTPFGYKIIPRSSGIYISASF